MPELVGKRFRLALVSLGAGLDSSRRTADSGKLEEQMRVLGQQADEKYLWTLLRRPFQLRSVS